MNMIKTVLFIFMATVDYCSSCWASDGSAAVISIHIPETAKLGTHYSRAVFTGCEHGRHFGHPWTWPVLTPAIHWWPTYGPWTRMSFL